MAASVRVARLFAFPLGERKQGALVGLLTLPQFPAAACHESLQLRDGEAVRPPPAPLPDCGGDVPTRAPKLDARRAQDGRAVGLLLAAGRDGAALPLPRLCGDPGAPLLCLQLQDASLELRPGQHKQRRELARRELRRPRQVRLPVLRGRRIANLRKTAGKAGRAPLQHELARLVPVQVLVPLLVLHVVADE